MAAQRSRRDPRLDGPDGHCGHQTRGQRDRGIARWSLHAGWNLLHGHRHLAFGFHLDAIKKRLPVSGGVLLCSVRSYLSSCRQQTPPAAECCPQMHPIVPVQRSLQPPFQNGLRSQAGPLVSHQLRPPLADEPHVMTIIRERTPIPTARAQSGIEVFVAECGACGFSAISRFEHDAKALVERHQRTCSKALAMSEADRTIKVHHRGDVA